MSVVSQPLLVDSVIRHNALYHVPKIFGMIHMGQMAELMDDYIIKRSCRTVDQTVIKGERASGRTAAPTGLLISDGDRGIVSAGEPVIICHAVCENFSGGITISVFQSL